MTDRVPEWISSDDNTRSRGSRTAKAARNILVSASDPDSPRSPGTLRDDDALGAARGAAQHDGGSRYCGIGTGGGRGAEARAREGWCGGSRGTGVRTPMYEVKGEARGGKSARRMERSGRSRGGLGEQEEEEKDGGRGQGDADGSCRRSLSDSWRPAYRVVVVSLSTASRRAALHRTTARRASTTMSGLSAAGKTVGGREDNAEVSWRSRRNDPAYRS
ncbi:hypothetical protein ALC60_13130 [Trachymyrmex zeteki]|uniref:Uncharacterized protein n=1 Tax=Mycetomoellerius zeteki TaxID=64791 RepID=A0A151WJ55_9HYME|nr:hypothetical protein ALC60_13130 [Trachymyrmex zeteki]